jgi:hypothetical protein
MPNPESARNSANDPDFALLTNRAAASAEQMSNSRFWQPGPEQMSKVLRELPGPAHLRRVGRWEVNQARKSRRPPSLPLYESRRQREHDKMFSTATQLRSGRGTTVD